jgi:hypothetical protein
MAHRSLNWVQKEVPGKVQLALMDKIKVTGLNLGRVFNYIYVGVRPHRQVHAHHQNSLTES